MKWNAFHCSHRKRWSRGPAFIGKRFSQDSNNNIEKDDDDYNNINSNNNNNNNDVHNIHGNENGKASFEMIQYDYSPSSYEEADNFGQTLDSKLYVTFFNYWINIWLIKLFTYLFAILRASVTPGLFFPDISVLTYTSLKNINIDTILLINNATLLIC